MVKLLTFNAGLIRMTPVDLTPLKWSKDLDENARGLPTVLNALAERHAILTPFAALAGLLTTPVWTQAQWIDERADALPYALAQSGADIICLQEVFEDQHRDHLLHELQDLYPYHAINLHPQTLGLNDGLLILSKLPIGTAQFAKFATTPWEERYLMGRGTLAARIDIPDQDPIVVINTHPTAAVAVRDPYGAEAAEYRRAQIKEVLQLARTFNKTDRVILTGDMNCGPTQSASEYELITTHNFVDAFLAAPDHPTGQDAYTFDTVHNPLNMKCNPEIDPPERLDHIFLPGNGPFKVDKVEVVFKDPYIQIPTAERMPLSDHYGVMAELTIEDASQEKAA